MISSIYNSDAINTSSKAVICTLKSISNSGIPITIYATLLDEFKFGVGGNWDPAMQLDDPSGLAGTFFKLAKLKGVNIHNTGGAATNKIFNGGKYPQIPLHVRIYGIDALRAANIFAKACSPVNELDGNLLDKYLDFGKELATEPIMIGLLALNAGNQTLSFFAGKNKSLDSVVSVADTVGVLALSVKYASTSKPGQMVWNIDIGDMFSSNKIEMCLDSVNFTFSNQRAVVPYNDKNWSCPLYVDFDLSFSSRTIPLQSNIGTGDNSFVVGGKSKRVTLG